MKQSTTSSERRRFRFRLRTLLLAPLILSALLLIVFPKLITGDFLKVEVKRIETSKTGLLQIELATTVSSGTGWRTNIGGGPFHSCSTGGDGWTQLFPTWPKRSLIVVKLGVNRDKLPSGFDDLPAVLAISPGDVYLLTPTRPLNLARAVDVNGKEGICRFGVIRGNRLGL